MPICKNCKTACNKEKICSNPNCKFRGCNFCASAWFCPKCKMPLKEA